MSDRELSFEDFFSTSQENIIKNANNDDIKDDFSDSFSLVDETISVDSDDFFDDFNSEASRSQLDLTDDCTFQFEKSKSFLKDDYEVNSSKKFITEKKKIKVDERIDSTSLDSIIDDDYERSDDTLLSTFVDDDFETKSSEKRKDISENNKLIDSKTESNANEEKADENNKSIDSKIENIANEERADESIGISDFEAESTQKEKNADESIEISDFEVENTQNEEIIKENLVDFEACKNILEKKNPLEFGTGESLHISRIELSTEDKTPENTIQTGFQTASKKEVTISKKNYDEVIMKLNYESGDFLQNDYKTKSFFVRENGKHLLESNELVLLESIYKKIQEIFKNEHKEWIYSQFKWSWLYFKLRKERMTSEELLQKIEEQMNLRKKAEYSILRRIVEGDEVPWRYMILLVINTTDDSLELFDGYYAISVLFDERIKEMVRREDIHIGCKLKIFGAQLLITTPACIYDVTSPVLKINYNGIAITYANRKLGYKKKLSFLKKIEKIKKTGGIISAVEGIVTRYVESKYLVVYENYRMITDDIETEMIKIEAMCKEADRKFESDKMDIRKYERFVMTDGTGECLVTWWNPDDEIKKNMKVRILYLAPVLKSEGLHLNTNKKTYFRILN